MTVVKGRDRAVAARARNSVVTNSILLARRIHELQRRRQALMAEQERLRAHLPDWAIEPLRLVGMTKEEIQNLVDDLSAAETESGLEAVESQIDELDRQVEDLENVLVATPSGSLEEIEAVLRLALARFREITVTDPGNVFYDHGEARVLALVERVHEDLAGVLQRSRLDVG